MVRMCIIQTKLTERQRFYDSDDVNRGAFLVAP